ncbi:hypothetical protein [Caballeronia mineralivorans]|nr:hypothetical protein [Caballeronia mineralivorans]
MKISFNRFRIAAQDDEFAVKVTAVEQPVNVLLLTHSVLAIVATRA